MRKSGFFKSPVISLALLLVIVSWGWIQGKDANKEEPTLNEKASYQAWSAACQTMLAEPTQCHRLMREACHRRRES